MPKTDMVKVLHNELLLVKLAGEFNKQALQDLLADLKEIESGKIFSKQLVYVLEMNDVSVKSDDVLFFRSQRPERHEPARTAFCVFNDFQYGIARMFQAVLETELHSIEIFRDIKTAAKWLDVDALALQEVSA